MKFELNQDTKKRADKAIANIRLIASRVKRAKLQDAMQKCEMVVNVLNAFRQYINLDMYISQYGDVESLKLRHQDIIMKMEVAAQPVDDIYNMLTREKKQSYKEEYKQVSLLIADAMKYFNDKIIERGSNATL